ncbi:MAG: signal peptidase I [Promethearchaeota archaeon]|nr:MAG: signal peptidase I [Candidatus Lokiarchaeota archaeon]
MKKNYSKKDLNKRILKKKEPSSKRKIIIAILLLTFAFSGSFLIYFIMQITLNTSTPLVVVVSGSMEPTLYRGDLLFLKGEDPATIKNGTIDGKEGDIIVFNAHLVPGWIYPPNDPIVHRVIDKKYDNGWFFLTKGDANPNPDDDWVPENAILGVVWGRIPYIGWVKIFLTDSGLLIPLLVIVSALLIISIIWDLVKKDDEGKDKKEGEQKLIYNPNAKDDDSVKEIEINFTENN